mmetsp:Transcript_7829/g.32380  ORF Transcript_7829/g.32380 Transcript_7829/m.32380 type:complete len:656 (-) Transcript_7829:62-2029(-)
MTALRDCRAADAHSPHCRGGPVRSVIDDSPLQLGETASAATHSRGAARDDARGDSERRSEPRWLGGVFREGTRSLCSSKVGEEDEVWARRWDDEDGRRRRGHHRIRGRRRRKKGSEIILSSSTSSRGAAESVGGEGPPHSESAARHPDRRAILMLFVLYVGSRSFGSSTKKSGSGGGTSSVLRRASTTTARSVAAGEVVGAEVGGVFELGRELAHRRVADHDVDELLEAPEDVLLDVRDAVLGAERLDERLRLLVGEHREVGPEVVFDLVVEPAVEEVVEVGARGEVGRRDDLAQVERARARLAVALEAVEVVAGVVGRDDEEGVHVGEDFGADEAREDRRVAAEPEEREREDDEALDEVRRERLHQEVVPLEEGRVARADEPREVEGLRPVRVLELGEPLLAPLVDAQPLVRVGRVVPPLPRARDQKDRDVLDGLRRLEPAQVLHVKLDEVGVVDLAEVVVVELVVLDVPRLDEHPVEPVDRAPVERPDAEPEPAVLLFGALVEAAVADVVADDGPSRERAEREAEDRRGHGGGPERGEGRQPRGGEREAEARPLAGARPPDDFAEVRDVGGALARRELLANRGALALERVEVDAVDPRVLGGELGRGVRRPREQLLRLGGEHERRRSLAAFAHGVSGWCGRGRELPSYRLLLF